MAGAAPLAVDDADAALPLQHRLGEEGAERRARLVLRHAVQVDLVADRVFAATQPAQHGLGDPVAAVAELVARLHVEIMGVEGERIGEHPGLVRAARRGARAAALALGRPLRLLERPHVAHGGAEQRAILVLDGGNLRPCAATARLQYSAARSRHTRPGRDTGP